MDLSGQVDAPADLNKNPFTFYRRTMFWKEYTLHAIGILY